MSNMNRFIILSVCAVMATVATGCTKELDDQILGTWKVSSITESVSGHPDAASNTDVTTSYGDRLTLTYTFADDHTGTAVQTVVATGQAVESGFTYTVANKDKTCTISWLSGAEKGQTHVWKMEIPKKKHMSFSRSHSVDGTYGDERGNLKPYTVTYTTSIVFVQE